MRRGLDGLVERVIAQTVQELDATALLGLQGKTALGETLDLELGSQHVRLGAVACLVARPREADRLLPDLVHLIEKRESIARKEKVHVGPPDIRFGRKT